MSPAVLDAISLLPGMFLCLTRKSRSLSLALSLAGICEGGVCFFAQLQPLVISCSDTDWPSGTGPVQPAASRLPPSPILHHPSPPSSPSSAHGLLMSNTGTVVGSPSGLRRRSPCDQSLGLEMDFQVCFLLAASSLGVKVEGGIHLLVSCLLSASSVPGPGVGVGDTLRRETGSLARGSFQATRASGH